MATKSQISIISRNDRCRDIIQGIFYVPSKPFWTDNFKSKDISIATQRTLLYTVDFFRRTLSLFLRKYISFYSFLRKLLDISIEKKEYFSLLWFLCSILQWVIFFRDWNVLFFFLYPSYFSTVLFIVRIFFSHVEVKWKYRRRSFPFLVFWHVHFLKSSQRIPFYPFS